MNTLTKKIIKRLSVCIRYWRYCNNHCDFCFEDNSSFKDTMYELPSVEAIENNDKIVNKLITEIQADQYTFKILGGELFAIQDRRVIDKLADSILYFYNILKNKTNFQSPSFVGTSFFVFASNLLYDDPTAIYQCFDQFKNIIDIEKFKFTLMASFDFRGRFNSEKSLMKFYNNYNDIKIRYDGIVRPVLSFVLTKQNMNILSEQIPCRELDIFNSLYAAGAPLDMQLLYNNEKTDMFKYTERDLMDFSNILHSKYPKAIKSLKDYAALYKNMTTFNYTVQGGRKFNDEQLFYKNKEKQQCIICQNFFKCRNTFHDIQYNCTKCDVLAIINDR